MPLKYLHVADIFYGVLKSMFKILAVVEKELRQQRNSVCKLGWQI